MIRFAAGIVIVSTIYAYSPVRPQGGATDDLSRWAQRTRDEAMTSIARSSFGRDLAAEAAKEVARETAEGMARRTAVPAHKPSHSPAG